MSFYEKLRNHINKLEDFILSEVLLCSMVTLLFLFIWLSFSNYILFHFIVESSTAILGYAVIIIAFNTDYISRNSFLLYLGISYAFVGSINILHAMTMGNMVFVNSTIPNITSKLDLFSGYLEIVSLIMSTKYLYKKIDLKKIYFRYLIAFSIIMIFVFKINLLELLVITEHEFNIFLKVNEYIIFLSFCYSLVNFKKHEENIKFNKNIIFAAIFIRMITEGLGILNQGYISIEILRHMLKLLYIILLYYAILKSSLKEPFKTLFYDVKNKAEKLEALNYQLSMKNKELKSSKERYEKMFEFLPEGAFLRKGNKIVYANNVILKMFNITDKFEIIGRNPLDFIHEDYKYIIQNRMSSNLEYVPPMEIKAVRKDGEVLLVESSSFCINIDEEEFYIIIFRDISQRKRLEELRLNLKKKIEEDRIKTEFLSNISHEIKTPINVIYSAVQLEDIYIEKGDIESIKKYNKHIKQNCMRLMRLTNNIIDITKVDAGDFKPTFACYNIVEIVEKVTESANPYAQNKNISLTFDTEVEEVYVNCDKDMMERIILNLLSNSIKYSKKDGNILVNVYCDGENFVNISVKDDGLGILKGKEEEVFQSFSKLDKSLTRKCEGTGIGLYLVKSFVELQNGKISMITNEGEGTEVIATFPAIVGMDEVCATLDMESKYENISTKVDMEFSDIYF
ncbi:PAS domain-containing sensor histidine kinase [Clostridium malenominatum]|uniref:histidine kinase n=1 Tax=Clostridium malenominatum TaxID=1539 RepID=A0ABN1J2Z4_9CLOT